MIIVDNNIGSTSARDKFFYMSGDTPDGIPPKEYLQLPYVFLFHEEASSLVAAMKRRWTSEKEPLVVMIAKREDNPSKLSSIFFLPLRLYSTNLYRIVDMASIVIYAIIPNSWQLESVRSPIVC